MVIKNKKYKSIFLFHARLFFLFNLHDIQKKESIFSKQIMNIQLT